MYYCENCAGRFDSPYISFEPLGEYGGERVEHCPLCHAPDMMVKENKNVNDKGESCDKQRI